MHALANIIITGWPDDIKVVPCPLCLYWQHHETLTIEDGFVLYGETLFVPPLERERVLQQLHPLHQGITKAQLLMHGCIFWPGINKAIKEVVHQCETCTWFQAQNTIAPLTPTPTPSHSCRMCTTDILTLEGVNYLICGDFYSKMISSDVFHLARETPSKSSGCSRKRSQSMESLKSFALTMVLNMQVPSLLISAPLWVSPTRPQALTIYNQMDLQRHV